MIDMQKLLELFNRFKAPPEGMVKKIRAGHLGKAGFSSVSPMWRYECLTKMFGLFGVGWWYDVDDVKYVSCDETKEMIVVLTIDLFYVLDENVSKPLKAFGAAHIIVKDKNGYHIDNDAHKKALTDALSVVCCRLGIASDVYKGVMDDKYDTYNSGDTDSIAMLDIGEKF